MVQYEVIAYKERRWWVFEIPALTSVSASGDVTITAMGQVRDASHITEEARDLAALWTETDVRTIDVHVTYRLPEEARTAIVRARQLDEEGRAALAGAASLRRTAVRSLRAGGLSQADSATVLGISRQRVQQLETT